MGTVRQSVMAEAFLHMGCQPEVFEREIQATLLSAHDAASFETLLLQSARQRRARKREEFTDTWLRLVPLQQAVLRRLLEQGESYRAFDAKALAFYGKQTSAKVSVAQVQRALGALRDNDSPLVWKSLRGDYSVYDQALTGWHAYLVGENNWSPRK